MVSQLKMHLTVDSISKREEQVLRLIAQEYTINEIADQLYLSHHTIVSHRRNLLMKLEVRNMAGLVRRGFELGILNLSRTLN